MWMSGYDPIFLHSIFLQITSKVFTTRNESDILEIQIQVTPNVNTKGALNYEDGI